MLWLLLLACTSVESTWLPQPSAGRAVIDAKAERVLRFGAPQAELVNVNDGSVLGTWDTTFHSALLPRDGGEPLVLEVREGLKRLGPSGAVAGVWGRDDGYPSGAKEGEIAWVGPDEQEVVLSGSRWLTHRFHLTEGVVSASAAPPQSYPAVILPGTGEVVSRQRRSDGVLFGWSATEERDLWVLKRELDTDRTIVSRYRGEIGDYNPEVFVRLSPDGQSVATAGYSDVVNVVDPVNAFVTAYLTAPWIELVTSVDWSGSGSEVLVGYADGRVAVFSAADGEVLWTGNCRDDLYRHGELGEWATQRVHRPQRLRTLPVQAVGLQEDGTVVVSHRLGIVKFTKAVPRP